MRDNLRIRQLLEDALDSKRTPEDVCHEYPELLHDVREQWERLQSIEAQIEALFPTPGPTRRAGATLPLWPSADLPRIPGYEVESVLGHGGMGVVYKARHMKLNRSVAIKMLLSGAFAGQKELECLIREAEAVAALRHAHIVQIYDVNDLDGLPYFTMEFLEGGTLAKKLAGAPQPARQAAEMMATLTDAVAAAHHGGIVHRDLKPANILLSADGTPKISDFGLARRFEGGPDITLSGAHVGTPSYMAPEQALGTTSAFCPSVDIYSLGGILYEMLTGRPPFLADTAAETERQVIAEEPASPSRLNAKIPRDLETICLKCLQKEPQRRYLSAAALAEDLGRFLNGRPIHARPVSRGEQLWRWCRRNPAPAALAATVLASVGLALGGGLWLERQWAERRAETARLEGRAWQAVQARLEQAAALEKQGRWPEARAALEVAPGVLDSSAPAELRERLRQARADAAMVVELEEIRLRLSEGRKAHETVSAERMYAAAFQKYGINLTVLEPAEAAALVRDSVIRATLLVFLHDWLYWVSDANRAQLQAVVDAADDNDWRRAFRKALAAKDATTLRALARAPEAAIQPPVVLSGLGGVLLAGNLRAEALALLQEAQEHYPEDFWINYLLGHFWDQERPQLAIGYLRAALAIRPKSDEAYAMLGRALRDTGDTEGAIAAFRKAIALNPNCPVGKDLARALAPGRGLEDARVVWEKALERDPPDHAAWYGYAQLCLFLGKEEAYHWARKAMLDRFGDRSNHWTVAERTSLACLLLPVSGDELQHAVKLTDRAVAAGPKSPDPDSTFLRFLTGLAEYRQGRLKQAGSLLQESAEKLPNRAGPRLVLAMTQFQSGSPKEARKSLAAAVRSYNWLEAQADHPTAWVSHVLRREAEAMILPNLPAFLRGEHQPQDNDERLALLGICQFQALYAAAARLYADAFAADPHLADELTAECLRRAAREETTTDRIEVLSADGRYLAARCAALAGCGLGKDAAKRSEAERTHWRKQAREWLRADLAAWAKTVDTGSDVARDLAKKMLTQWRSDHDLAGLRDQDALDKLPSREREECIALWNEVGSVLNRSEKTK